MNQLAIIDRGAAARKAWATRRAQGWAHNGAHKSGPVLAVSQKPAVAEALAAFEREAQSDMPDWHRAALVLRQALGKGSSKALARPSREPRAPRPLALPPSDWVDYEVGRVNAFAVRNPTIIVTFASGDVVRAPAVSLKGRALNIGRGLRCAIAFYQARACRRRGFRYRPGVHRAVPAIEACVCEDTAETFDAEECTVRTIEDRKAQDWRIGR